MSNGQKNYERNGDSLRKWLPLLAHIGGLLALGGVVVTKVNRLESVTDEHVKDYYQHIQQPAHNVAAERHRIFIEAFKRLEDRIDRLERMK